MNKNRYINYLKYLSNLKFKDNNDIKSYIIKSINEMIQDSEKEKYYYEYINYLYKACKEISAEKVIKFEDIRKYKLKKLLK